MHLSPPARAILADLPRRAGTDLVFTTTGRTPPSGFSKVGQQLRDLMADAGDREQSGGSREAQTSPWRLHDFRRTGVTALARLGIPPHVADRLLNHIQGSIQGVAAVYQRHQFMAEREAALNRWAEHVVDTSKAVSKPREPNKR